MKSFFKLVLYIGLKLIIFTITFEILIIKDINNIKKNIKHLNLLNLSVSLY